MRGRRFRSFAKINLGLEVVGELPGGYHELKTIFASLDIHDVVEIGGARQGIRVESNHPAIADDPTNLAYRAAAAMQRLAGTKTGVAIRLEKNIPVGGGLGGGSSNAATVLRALDRLWGLDLGVPGLLATAKALGADVPYFLFGGPALGLSRGDDIHPLAGSFKEKVLVIPGAGGLSTAAVFAQLKASPPARRSGSRIDGFLKARDPAYGASEPSKGLQTLRNDLEAAAFAKSPALRITAEAIAKAAHSSGALHSAMSGSGTSFFMLFDDASRERAAAQDLARSGINSIRCRFLSRRGFQSRFECKPLS